MNFDDLNDFGWKKYNGQSDKNATYVFVSNGKIQRLKGKSDILYFGKTKQYIKNRYKQETSTKNTDGNTQQTNIRTTHVFSQIGLKNFTCYYVKQMEVNLSEQEMEMFLPKLKIWSKGCYLKVKNNDEIISLEKYLLVNYTNKHLEVPPLNFSI